MRPVGWACAREQARQKSPGGRVELCAGTTSTEPPPWPRPQMPDASVGLASVSVCCSASGVGPSSVSFTLADGTSVSAGACASGARRRQLLQGSFSSALAPGGSLTSIHGSRAFGLGTLSFGVATPRASPPPLARKYKKPPPPAPPSLPLPPSPPALPGLPSMPPPPKPGRRRPPPSIPPLLPSPPPSQPPLPPEPQAPQAPPRPSLPLRPSLPPRPPSPPPPPPIVFPPSPPPDTTPRPPAMPPMPPAPSFRQAQAVYQAAVKVDYTPIVQVPASPPREARRSSVFSSGPQTCLRGLKRACRATGRRYCLQLTPRSPPPLPPAVQGVPAVLPNRVPAVAMVLVGTGAVPVVTTDSREPVVATTRYGRGRAAAFGEWPAACKLTADASCSLKPISSVALRVYLRSCVCRLRSAGGERMITGCCSPLARNGRPASDSAIDKLIVNMATWAAWWATKVRARRGEHRRLRSAAQPAPLHSPGHGPLGGD
jgi:hypothetical protein